MLLQQGDQEVDAQVDVLHQLVLVHRHVANGHVQAKNLKKVVELSFHNSVKSNYNLVKSLFEFLRMGSKL